MTAPPQTHELEGPYAAKSKGEPASPYALELEGISKQFGEFSALSNVELSVRRGEIHALLGENGAGKTTLMNIVAGLYQADNGTIAIQGQQVIVRNPRDAVALGVGMVHQQFSLVDKMTVAENIHLGWSQAPRIARPALLEERTAAMIEQYGLDIDPSTPVWHLSVGEMQRVAILRALVRGAQILILDEPTAVLTPHEADRLFDSLRDMQAEGRTIILISHKLREVMAIADRVTVLRQGQLVVSTPIRECDERSLVVHMVGKELSPGVTPASYVRGGQVLAAERVSAKDERGQTVLRDIDLELDAGEIVGVASISGNGGRELAEVLSGMRSTSSGSVRVLGREPGRDGSRGFIRHDVGHIPEHYRTALALESSLETNTIMKAIDDPTMRRKRLINWKSLQNHTTEILAAASLHAVSPRRRTATLSGGQAQRMVIQRELRAGRRVLIACYPTRGLDVVATQGVQEALISAREAGVAVLLLSEDLGELFTLSDRLIVMYEGRIVGRLNRQEFDLNRVGHLMAGVKA